MPIDLPLDSMSVSDKLQVMEAVWTSLCREPVDFRSPQWHEEILRERRARLATGQATVSDWSEAKKRLQDLGR